MKIPEIHRKYLVNSTTPYIYKISNTKDIKIFATGFLISHNNRKFIITNKHVCEGMGVNGVIYVNTPTGVLLESFIVDKNHDLCAINAPSILGDGLSLGLPPDPYDSIYAMGYPMINPLRLISGYFFLSKNITVQKDLFSYFMILSVYPGNSGSPILNIYGNVIGVVYAYDETQSFAVPLEYLKEFLEYMDKNH